MGHNKIRNQYGEAGIIVILIVIALLLATAIVIPIVRNASERTLIEADEEYEVAARRMAMTDTAQKSEGNYRVVYDGIAKKFVEPGNIDGIQEYTSSKEYAGKYIVVTFKKDSEPELTWMTKESIRKLAD